MRRIASLLTLAGAVVLVAIAYVCYQIKAATRTPEQQVTMMRNFCIAATFAIGVPVITTFHAFFIAKAPPSQNPRDDDWT